MIKNKKEGDENKLVFVGTDSFRLSEYKLAANGISEDFALIIPKISINDLYKISNYAKDHNVEEIKLQYGDNLAAFSCQIDELKILATSLLIQGNFPDYDREEIMPNNFNSSIIVDKHLCEKAIKKIAILTRDINNFIQIQMEENQVIISSGKTDKGAGTTSIPALIS